MFAIIAAIANQEVSLKLWVGMANLQLSSHHIIIDWQKQDKILVVLGVAC